MFDADVISRADADVRCHSGYHPLPPDNTLSRAVGGGGDRVRETLQREPQEENRIHLLGDGLCRSLECLADQCWNTFWVQSLLWFFGYAE